MDIRVEMPKRSNTFQQLVFHLQRQLAGQSTVTESKFLKDRVTWDAREVDVVIESAIGEYELTISVECVAGGRKASVEWVERMVEKHRNLPTNQLVLVAKAGFSKSAQRKADSAGVRTYSLGKAIDADWTEIVGRLERIFFARFEFKLQSFAVRLDNPSSQFHLIGPGQAFLTAAGEHIASALEIGHHILNQHPFASRVMDEVKEDGEKRADYEVEAPADWYVVDTSGQHHLITTIRLHFTITRRSAPIELSHASWNDVPVAFGAGETAFGSTFVSFIEPKEGPGGALVTMPHPGSGEVRTYATVKPVKSGEGLADGKY
jgi:hypothetical protein